MCIKRMVVGLSLTMCSALWSKGNEIFFAKYLENDTGKMLLYQGYVPGSLGTEARIREERYPRTIIEHEAMTSSWIVEIHGQNKGSVQSLLESRNVAGINAEFRPEKADEVMTLVDSGPSDNRIDLVFMGDGYTQGEREKFIEDMKRLSRDMFEGETFSSYLPLFNVHAVYRVSRQSGIGKNSTPKDTAYGLYRVGNTLRAIFASNTVAAEQSCRSAPGCDYGIIVGNDPYYGGLGGEFAITTSSHTSGTMVLRHELGHNFGRVGEEYDGGGYFGANHASSLSSVGWKHWLTGSLVTEKAVARFIGWPWHYLGDGAFERSFVSDGKYAYSDLQFSASGIENDETLQVQLDGQDLSIHSPGHSDRAFHTLSFNSGFTNGTHKIRFAEKLHDNDNWLSDLTLYEYASDYHFDENYVGAFPLFQSPGVSAGYRSTHETCLMRNMESQRFCSVCQENNWVQFLARVDLIDRVGVVSTGQGVSVSAHFPNLGQFRGNPRAGERLEIRWVRNGTEVAQLNDRPSWSLPMGSAQGSWELRIRLITPEVRNDPQGYLFNRKQFSI